MTMDSNYPKIRVRINHSRTAKEGWKFESTVEIDEYSAPDGADLYRMCKELLQDIDTLAREESARRNALDAIPEGKSKESDEGLLTLRNLESDSA